MDGWITIGTELSTDKFDKQIANLEKKIQQEEEKAQIKIETKTTYERALERERENTDKLAQKYEEMLHYKKEYDKAVKIMNTTDFPAERWIQAQKTAFELGPLLGEEKNGSYANIIKLEEQLGKAVTKEEQLENKIKQTEQGYNQITNKVKDYKQQIEGIKLQKHQEDVDKVKKSVDGMGTSLQGAVGKVSKLALAVIGVRSIFLGIRKAVNDIAQYDDGIAGRLDAIKLSLSSALAPVVEFIVSLLEKAMSLLGYILKSLFGIDIFANASAMAMKKASKSAKDLKKQLAGFDEMNILNDNGTTGALGSTLSALKDMDAMGEDVFNSLKNWLWPEGKNIFEITADAFQDMYNNITEGLKPLAEWIDKNVWQPNKKNFEEAMKLLEPYIEPFRQAWEDLLENQLKPMWTDFVNFMEPNVVQPILNEFEPIGRDIYNFLVPYANDIIDMINNIFGVFGVNLEHWEYKTDETTDDVQKDMQDTFNNVENSADRKGKEVESDFINPMNNIGDKADELSNTEIDMNADTTDLDNAQWTLDDLLKTLEEIVNDPWTIVTRITTQVGSSFNNLFSKIREKFSSFGIELPYMATGGIVNMPNKGTLVGGAMAGESGHEGVIPLTDTQAMETLGQAIGRYITVNANITNTMNGRVISRELQQIQNEQNFAYNL